MAAYAALVSLLNTIHLIQNHPRYSFSFDKNQIGCLSGNAQFFLEFVESVKGCHQRSKQVEDLEIQIAFVACLAEYHLTSLANRQILDGFILNHGEDRARPRWSFSIYPQSTYLKKVIDRMSSIVGEIEKDKNKSATKHQHSTDAMVVASTRSPTTGKTSMVGFKGYLLQLMDVLTGHQSPLQIISVVGMGGIDKTTLAKNVYDNLGIVHYFDVRSWVTISQEYDIKGILLQLLDRKGESSEDTSDELGEKLHKKLWGRRYLIILDDMWSTDVWDRIRFFFPDNDNRSRIVITTRITNVSSHLSSSPLEMRLLDDDESWKLFNATTFGKEECPHNLVEIGKNIVRKCRGLPLSIVVIGGHLKKASRMQEEWESIARNMIAFLDSGEDQCLTILSLSYTNLPTCLKPCFLYMGILSEDEKIGVQTLIRLWVAEGFMQPDGSRSFEEIAESYLKDLVDRNLLILALEEGWNGKMLTCKVHDLVREVCLKEGRKERFFCMLKHGGGYSRCTHEENFVGSGICLVSEKHWHNFKKDNIVFMLDFYPDWHLNFRYIGCSSSGRIPSSISRSWNLQTLIIQGREIHAPYEIWEMSWLRHLNVWVRICLPDPPERHLICYAKPTDTRGSKEFEAE